ncbi:MAG TPA: DUF2092 domain-containing protein [Candidatus Binataceae bacterium]|nr:DUF2092 domain-containing protein [Candidatus Binataceae bacterium]
MALAIGRMRNACILVAAIALAGCAQHAQPPASAQQKVAECGQSGLVAQPTPSGIAPVPMMEQPALDLLKKMSNTLADSKAFTVRSRSTAEVPAKTGQYVTLFGTSDVILEKPNKLYVHVTGEVPNFDFYYDGKQVTAYAPKNNVYSVIGAPPTIDATLDFVEAKTGIHFPSAYVMSTDPYDTLTKGVTSAFVVGSDTVDGVPCKHLAFRVPGANWEIWIESNENALPRRLAVTYTKVRNFPRALVEYSRWHLLPKVPAGRFVFKKPHDAKQIEFRARDLRKSQ